MRRSLTTRLALLALASLAVAVPRALADPGWISSCQFSHSAPDDPIVFPEQPGAAHLHDFVAARTTDAFSTPDSLRAGGTTCPMPGDTSAYWSPAAYEDGLHIGFGTNKHALFYYRRKAAPTGLAVAPFPDGLKLLVGNGHATSAQDNPGIVSGNITFKCGPGSAPETPTPPLACSGGVLVVVFIFPNCWDGFQLDSADHFSHMAYPVGSLCPPSHPVVVPRIQGFWRYAVGVDPIELSLSSGDWWTVHTDFFNAWKPNHLQWLLDNCINANLDCGTDPVPVLNEFAPDITSDGGGPTAAVSAAENQTAVTDVNATDGDGQTLTYSISGGPDAARFTIAAATGVLTFLAPPNFEAPTDDGLNNVYDVTVQASDGSLSDTQALAVTVTDASEGPAILYFSVTTAQTLSGIPVTPQDIVAFDGASYSLFVDGSDVGLDVAADSIDAFSLLADGRVLVSTTGNPTVVGVSGGRDEDVLVLSSGERGATTTGTWSLYLDGSVVGLEASGEDTDAIELLDDGRLLVSTSGAVSVTGVTGEDKDVLAYTPGAPGSWALYFDGSAVGLTTSGEDVDGVAFRNGDLYLSTTGNFGVAGLSGADEDVFACTSVTTGQNTSCASFSLFFDGSLFGLAANDLFAIELP